MAFSDDLTALGAPLLVAQLGHPTVPVGDLVDLAHSTFHDARYRRWVPTHADPGVAALGARCAQMLDETAPDRATAERAFLAGMRSELAFWDVP